MTKWPLQTKCDEFYGNPRGKNGQPSAAWESKNLTTIKPPYRMTYDGKPVSGIRVHKLCAESLLRVLNRIWDAAGRKQSVVDAWGASIYGGCYNFRLMRGGNALSMHSWGCAIDLDPANNGLGDSTPKFDKAPEVRAAFAAEGWEWGGDWSRKDGMHWQAAWTRANAVKPGAAVSAPAAPAKPATPASKPAAPAMSKEAVMAMQTRLRDLGYTEVGNIDGGLGTMTETAIRAFRADNGLPEGGHVDDALLVALAKAEPRKLSPARANATPAEVRATVPEAAQAFKAKVVSAGAAVGSGGLALVSGVASNVSAAKGYIEPIKDFANDVPGWAWLAVVFVVALAIWRISAKGEQATVAAVQDGSRR